MPLQALSLLENIFYDRDSRLYTTLYEFLNSWNVNRICESSQLRLFLDEMLDKLTDHCVKHNTDSYILHISVIRPLVQANVGQKAGAGMHVVSATVWDESTDGSASVHWSNTGVLALVTVFWVKM